MTTSRRKIEAYDAARDALERWPGWRIVRTNLEGIREVIAPAERVILWDERRCETEAVAHCVAHLDLGHHNNEGWLSEDAEDSATWLAKMRVDGDRSWC